MSFPSPIVLRTAESLRRFVAAEKSAGRRLGLVPTMGALHEGHLSLMRAARAECDTVLASIFVNPTQFGPREDFEKYPRMLESDLVEAARCNVAAVFAPAAEEMYPPGFSTYVAPPSAATPLEGALRPDHFRGVCTVVLKLFLLSGAESAYFGQKDYQQAQVIRRLAADLNVPVDIRVCPIVREADGLAMSSRNAYLSIEERQRALAISRALRDANEAFLAGQRDARPMIAAARETLAHHGLERIDYVAAIDPETIESVDRLQPGAVLAIAAYAGATRLIDNWRLGVD